MANAARLRKSVVATFYVYFVFLVCYLPRLCIYVATYISGPSTAIHILRHNALTLLFLNSSLNPLIYCWKMSHVRHAIMDTLRKILTRLFPSHNWEQQPNKTVSIKCSIFDKRRHGCVQLKQLSIWLQWTVLEYTSIWECREKSAELSRVVSILIPSFWTYITDSLLFQFYLVCLGVSRRHFKRRRLGKYSPIFTSPRRIIVKY